MALKWHFVHIRTLDSSLVIGGWHFLALSPESISISIAVVGASVLEGFQREMATSKTIADVVAAGTEGAGQACPVAVAVMMVMAETSVVLVEA